VSIFASCAPWACRIGRELPVGGEERDRDRIGDAPVANQGLVAAACAAIGACA